jgi:hypothetical protein
MHWHRFIDRGLSGAMRPAGEDDRERGSTYDF